MTKDQIINDIDDFFICYIESIGGYENFGYHHSIRSKEMYMSSWLEYRDHNIDFKNN